MTHFVVKVIQLYLGPEVQHMIIPIGVIFYRCSCNGKILNRIIHSLYSIAFFTNILKNIPFLAQE